MEALAGKAAQEGKECQGRQESRQGEGRSGESARFRLGCSLGEGLCPRGWGDPAKMLGSPRFPGAEVAPKSS